MISLEILTFKDGYASGNVSHLLASIYGHVPMGKGGKKEMALGKMEELSYN